MIPRKSSFVELPELTDNIGKEVVDGAVTAFA
jgi:hypothetical protein